jgi:hypothetical protein
LVPSKIPGTIPGKRGFFGSLFLASILSGKIPGSLPGKMPPFQSATVVPYDTANHVHVGGKDVWSSDEIETPIQILLSSQKTGWKRCVELR